MLSSAGATDLNIDSMTTHSGIDQNQTLYLHTSPEYAMKRLLAAGSGSIYQLCKVFRYGEQGKQHHPEFTMLEWYRLGFDHLELMDEVDELIRQLLNDSLKLSPTIRWTYQQAWQQIINIDPFSVSIEELQAFAQKQNIEVVGPVSDKDAWLQLIMSFCIEPVLPKDTPIFIYDYPASQAALAKVRNETLPVAERFELYINGMELANGFHELTETDEQRQRFEADNQKRKIAGKDTIPVDEGLLAALPHLPACAGVALGLDRMMMLITGEKDILQVIVD